MSASSQVAWPVLSTVCDARADLRPDLRPHLPRGAAERPRVLLARACRAGRRRCRGRSAPGPTPSTWQTARSAAPGRRWPARWATPRSGRAASPPSRPRACPGPPARSWPRNSRRLWGEASVLTPRLPPASACAAGHQQAHPECAQRWSYVKRGFRSAAASSRCDGTGPCTKRLLIWRTCKRCWTTASPRPAPSYAPHLRCPRTRSRPPSSSPTSGAAHRGPGHVTARAEPRVAPIDAFFGHARSTCRRWRSRPGRATWRAGRRRASPISRAPTSP